MLEGIKEFFTTLLILVIIFPPLGIAILATIGLIIDELLGTSGTSSGYDYGDGPQYSGKEAMRFIKSVDPKGYEDFVRKYPEERID